MDLYQRAYAEDNRLTTEQRLARLSKIFGIDPNAKITEFTDQIEAVLTVLDLAPSSGRIGEEVMAQAFRVLTEDGKEKRQKVIEQAGAEIAANAEVQKLTTPVAYANQALRDAGMAVLTGKEREELELLVT